MSKEAFIKAIDAEIASRDNLTVEKTDTGIIITGTDFEVKATRRAVFGRGYRREIELKCVYATLKVGLTAEEFAEFITRHITN